MPWFIFLTPFFAPFAIAAIRLWQTSGPPEATGPAPSRRAPGGIEPGDCPIAAAGRFPGEDMELQSAIADVVRGCEKLAARRMVRLGFAVQEGLTLRANPVALRLMIADLIECAIRLAPCGAVLISAARHGGRIQITVSDDGPGRQIDWLRSELRPAEQIAALHGGTLELRGQTAHGGAIVVRLPDAANARAQHASTKWVPASDQSGENFKASSDSIEPSDRVLPVQQQEAGMIRSDLDRLIL